MPRRPAAHGTSSASTNLEPEPRVLCGLPVGGAVGILGSVLMICQIFGLFYLSPFMLYFFEISIGSAMMFILSTGAKHRKIAYVTAYMLYISMYTFWVFFLVLGAILATIYLVDNNNNVCPPADTVLDSISTSRPCIASKFTTGDVEMVIISCFFLSISIIIAVIQMRYLMILYHFLRRTTYRLPSHTSGGYNVQYIVPTPISPSGMPPPPRYTVHAPPPFTPTAAATVTKQSMENNSAPSTTTGPIQATPILGATQGVENSAFANDEHRDRALSNPPPYTEVAEPAVERRDSTTQDS